MKNLTDKKFWDKFYSKRNNEKKLGEQWGGITQAHLKTIFDKYLSRGNLDYLEMGCGNSSWLIYFAKYYNYNVTGVDYSHKGIEYLKQRLKLEGLKADLYEEDFFELKDKLKKKFDIVSSFGVIEHFEKPCEPLKLFSLFLKKDGILVTGIPKLIGMQGFFQKILDKEIYLKHKPMSLEDIIEKHKKAGLTIVDSFEIGFGTIGLNLTNRKILKKFYIIYSSLLNKVLRRINFKLIDKLKIGSYYLILSRID